MESGWNNSRVVGPSGTISEDATSHRLQMSSRIASCIGPLAILIDWLARCVKCARSPGIEQLHVAKKRHALPSQPYERR